MDPGVRFWAKVALGLGILCAIPTIAIYWQQSLVQQQCQLVNAAIECEKAFDTFNAWMSWPASLQLTAILTGLGILFSGPEVEQKSSAEAS
jgi:hypothetical protein